MFSTFVQLWDLLGWEIFPDHSMLSGGKKQDINTRTD